MKANMKLILISVAMIATSTTTFAAAIGLGYDAYCHGCSSTQFVLACAPEVAEGNVEATQRVLTEIGQNELKDADRFNAIVKQNSALPSEEKIAAYLNMAGIQSDQQLADFVGSRDSKIEQHVIDTFSKRTELSEDQARFVLQQISRALLGNRK